MAIEVAKRLNIEERRDKALLSFIEAALRLPASKIDLSFVANAVESIAAQKSKGIAIYRIVARLHSLSEKNTPIPESLLQLSLQFINAIEKIQDTQPRCDAYCMAYVFLNRQNDEHQINYSGLRSDLLKRLEKSWSKIDVQWVKIDVGFSIAKSLAKDAPETAEKYLKLAKQIRNEYSLDAETSASTYLQSLKLAIRAYTGLLPQRFNQEADFNELKNLIIKIPSYGEQAVLWGDIAIRMSLNKHLDECKDITSHHIKPLLRKIDDGDTGYKTNVIVALAPALYQAHELTAVDIISKLPQPSKDKAYARVCEFLLRQQPPDEPYENLPNSGYDNLTYENIVSICELLDKKMDNDGLIYQYISDIADSIVSRRRHHRFSNEQISDIVTRLERVIAHKLPGPTGRNITHDGYKIIGQAQIIRIREKTRTKPTLQEWSKLIKSALSIPNLADKALVLFTIATLMPSSASQQRKSTIEDAIELVEKNPVVFDKVGIYNSFAYMVYTTDRELSKRCIKLAMTLTIKEENPEYLAMQRNVIDLANKIDGDFAASLADLIDDDPARTHIKKNVQEYLKFLDFKKQMTQSSSVFDSPSSFTEDNFPKAAWRNLGNLNAGRIPLLDLDKTYQFMKIASTFPLNRSYPIMAFVIENVVRRFATTAQTGTHLRPMYKSMLSSVKLSERMVTRSTKYLEQAINYTVKSPEDESLLVLNGEREQAVAFLRKWFTEEVENYLKIHDPYFGPNELEVLTLLASEKPDCKVYILTSEAHHKNQGITNRWEEHYQTAWRDLSEQDPPDTLITIIGMKSGASPIHDRWWVTDNAGIRMGSSLNGLGESRISAISKLSPSELPKIKSLIDQYLFGPVTEHKGERLYRRQFPLTG